MGLTKLKVKAKVSGGRGTGNIDATVVMKALQDYWEELQ